MAQTKNGMHWHEVLHPDRRKDMIYTAVLFLAALGIAVGCILGVLRSAGVAGLGFSEPFIAICFAVVMLDLLIASFDRDDNEGMLRLLEAMCLICIVITVLFAVAFGIYCSMKYQAGIVAAAICLVFFLIQSACYMMAFRKLKRMAPHDLQAHKRFRKCKFYAMLLVAVIVVVTVAALLAPEEESHQVLAVFFGSFLSLMVFTQMADVYMIEVPKEAKNRHDASKLAKMNRLHRSRHAFRGAR